MPKCPLLLRPPSRKVEPRRSPGTVPSPPWQDGKGAHRTQRIVHVRGSLVTCARQCGQSPLQGLGQRRAQDSVVGSSVHEDIDLASPGSCQWSRARHPPCSSAAGEGQSPFTNRPGLVSEGPSGMSSLCRGQSCPLEGTAANSSKVPHAALAPAGDNSPGLRA